MEVDVGLPVLSAKNAVLEAVEARSSGFKKDDLFSSLLDNSAGTRDPMGHPVVALQALVLQHPINGGFVPWHVYQKPWPDEASQL